MSRESHASRLQSHSLLALGEQLTEETSSLRSFARSGQILVVSCECEGPIDWGTMLVDGGKGGQSSQIINASVQCIQMHSKPWLLEARNQKYVRYRVSLCYPRLPPTGALIVIMYYMVLVRRHPLFRFHCC